MAAPTSSGSRPPEAKRVPTPLTIHGHTRTDDYLWLHQREDPEVVAHLEAENAYTQAMTAHLAGFRDTVYEEIIGRIKQTDMSVPYRWRDHWYYARFEEGKEYPVHCRKPGSLESEEEVLLDVNEMAEGYSYYSIGGTAISHQQDILAFAVDTIGRRLHSLHFKHLPTGQVFDGPEEIAASLAWANDNQHIFYVRKDPETLRPFQVWRHRLQTDVADDVLVYQEDDETFIVSVGKTRSQRYIMIGCHQTVSTEVHFLDADDPTAPARVFLPRRRDHEYSVDHFRDRFTVLTNHEAQNFRLMETTEMGLAPEQWTEVIPHRDDVLLSDFDQFRDFLVVSERRDGLTQLRILPWEGDGEHYLEFDEPAYTAYVGTNPEPDTDTLRFGYTSLTTPNSVYDYDMRTRKRVLKKRQEVVGDFDPGRYETHRLHATAADGTSIPISLVVRSDRKRPEGNPLLLYAYGSYGISIDPSFSSPRLSLLDRGFAFAIAHIRGGEDLGRRWYEDGKLLRKKNTFDDFVSCGEHLVAEGVADPKHLYAMGGSAGGLLMGAILNLRPDLFAGIVAQVPFVDIVTTMLDDSIPLTTGEYDEWGNPNDKSFYEYMLSYSPYDNVMEREYPAVLVTTGFHDSQVQYWEPAKWVAKLRRNQRGDAPILLKTNMEAGHSGATGRFRYHQDTAFEYAFLLDRAELAG